MRIVQGSIRLRRQLCDKAEILFVQPS
uniref:Uncharacterized protein n=1 Tax=Arundo donax TaxID=35708 RepID=A0A0A8ZR58_ARUDO